MKRRAPTDKAPASTPAASVDSDDDDDLGELAVAGSSKKSKLKSARAARETAAEAEDADADKAKEETPDEIRVRLARQYLESLGIDKDGGSGDDNDDEVNGINSSDDDEYGNDAVGQELRRRAQRARGKEHRRALVPQMLERAVKLAPTLPALPPQPPVQSTAAALTSSSSSSSSSSYNTSYEAITSAAAAAAHAYAHRSFGPVSNLFSSADVRIMRGHRLPPTCLALEEDDSTVYSASKDSSILRFDVETGARTLFNAGAQAHRKLTGLSVKKCPGHNGEVSSMSLSSDGLYLATGGKDGTVRIWDTRSQQQVEVFHEHRDAVSSVAFRRDSLALYSGSYDRTVNVYNIEQMAFVEPLYGHQSPVTALTALYQERAYSVGEDRTMRVWKVAQESQLLFRAPAQTISLDAIAALAPDTVITGSEDGTLSLWHTGKRRPCDNKRNAHGERNWISSVAALYPTDLVASGSCDGFVRFWQSSLHTGSPVLTPAFAVPVTGWVNGLAIGREGRFAVAAVGQEHRLGRWSRIPEARCGVHVLDLSKIAEETGAGSSYVTGTGKLLGAEEDGEGSDRELLDDSDKEDDDDAAAAALKRGLAAATDSDDDGAAAPAAPVKGKKGAAAADAKLKPTKAKAGGKKGSRAAVDLDDDEAFFVAEEQFDDDEN